MFDVWGPTELCVCVEPFDVCVLVHISAETEFVCVEYVAAHLYTAEWRLLSATVCQVTL